MTTRNFRVRGVGSAAVAGLVFATGALAVLTAQQRRHDALYRKAEEERSRHHRHMVLAAQQRLQFDMLTTAMGDPDLAAVLDTYETPLDARTQRQYLFANAMYTNVLLAWRVGNLGWDELHGHLRLICQNAIFRNYWAATRGHRASLLDSSDEARLGRMVDKLIRDLEAAGTDEWWVVGEPPPE
ncbi:hypothetical protein DMA15_28095 [Streptomyces sp. WAC 01529]|uniref:DUF6082 family protein n=1 Tax=Streptomyces sp. WAC 01529 TaxID=2203205 RepID=UPI000F6E93C6|nr:DUF6082 family protein [Streptomyces sp. WAC 01529]AZM55974.1 hypothetical protein DMA15_28095 [Streptomyces sp. WAC 01529]